MNLTEAKEVLEKNGMEVKLVDAMKGSCIVQGLSIGDGMIKPTLYEPGIADMTEEELIAFVRKTMEQVPEIDLLKIHDKEFVLSHSISCIRHQTDDKNAIKWPVYGDLEEYVRLNLGQDDQEHNMSCVVSHDLIRDTGISAEELRHYARNNLKAVARIESMAQVLHGLIESETEIPETDEIMYVATTESKLYGASVMLLESLLQDFCVEHGLDSIYLIPSSQHEVIITAAKMPMLGINSMIDEVNSTQVDAWDQLSNHVYTFVAA